MSVLSRFCLSSTVCIREYSVPSASHLRPIFVPEHLRASRIGWYNTMLGLAGLVASIVAGLLWDHIGHSAVFLYGAAFAAAGCIALSVFIPAKQG